MTFMCLQIEELFCLLSPFSSQYIFQTSEIKTNKKVFFPGEERMRRGNCIQIYGLISSTRARGREKQRKHSNGDVLCGETKIDKTHEDVKINDVRWWLCVAVSLWPCFSVYLFDWTEGYDFIDGSEFFFWGFNCFWFLLNILDLGYKKTVHCSILFFSSIIP